MPGTGDFMQLIVGGAGRVGERPFEENLTTMDTVIIKHHFSHLVFGEDRITARIIRTDGTYLDEFEYIRK